MGLQSYLFTRRGTFDRSSRIYRLLKRTDPFLFHIFFAKVPGEPSRIQSLSSLSNAINNVVIQRQSGAAFGRTRFFVITPDRTMNSVVRQALRRLGVRGPDIFTEPVPPLGRPLGLGKPADDFVTAMRYAEPANEAAAARWRRTLPLVVLRIRYVGLSVNETKHLLGVANVSDPAMKGTAAAYAARVRHTGKLFVYYLTRNCAGLRSLTGGHCLSIRRRMVPAGGTFSLALRDYIRPGTERGPDSAKLLTPWVIMLKRPAAR